MARVSIQELAKQNVEEQYRPDILNSLTSSFTANLDSKISAEEQRLKSFYHQKFIQGNGLSNRLCDEVDQHLRSQQLDFTYFLLEIDKNASMPKEHLQLVEYFRGE